MSLSGLSQRPLYPFGPDRRGLGKKYLGAVHGEIGIVSQLVLSMSSVAPGFEGKLLQLLASCLANGSRPSSMGKEVYSLVQLGYQAALPPPSP